MHQHEQHLELIQFDLTTHLEAQEADLACRFMAQHADIQILRLQQAETLKKLESQLKIVSNIHKMLHQHLKIRNPASEFDSSEPFSPPIVVPSGARVA